MMGLRIETLEGPTGYVVWTVEDLSDRSGLIAEAATREEAIARLRTSVTGTSRSSSFGREISPAEERTV